MHRTSRALLPFVIAGLTACAAGAPGDRIRNPDINEIARELGCTSEEVAVCVDVNCEPHEYQCAHRSDVKALLGVQEYPRR